ncbi:outer membrane protein assembly factor BamB family protein [Nocardia yamanashiensis]|uniref:outer membrane protein assembly factor BamB family protein n=1 Tax=Nocardia yamanashiensis TaxID=209247 RepID=UPI0012FD77EA|nr:PQQ-binding-like beta-propeller repeat protein [Nocardia yamanashiensis]
MLEPVAVSLLSRRKLLMNSAFLLAGGLSATSCGPAPALGETAASGTIVWRYGLENEQLRALRYSNGVVLADTGTGITGIDAKTGKKLWQATIAGPGIDRHAFITEGTLYLCGAEPDGERAIALDAVSGQRKWTFDAPADTALIGIHGLRDGIAYLFTLNRATAHHEILAVDTTTRAIRWTAPCPTDNTALHIPATGALIYSSRENGGDLIAFDTENNGATVWSKQDDPTAAATTIATGLVAGVILATDGSRIVSALDPKTGAQLWKTPELATPADTFFADADTYYRCDGAKLQALRPGPEAAVLWTLTVSDKAEAHLATAYLTSGTCYFLAANTLRAIDARTGNPRWSRTIDIPTTPFTVGETHCYLGSPSDPATSGLIAIAR